MWEFGYSYSNQLQRPDQANHWMNSDRMKNNSSDSWSEGSTSASCSSLSLVYAYTGSGRCTDFGWKRHCSRWRHDSVLDSSMALKTASTAFHQMDMGWWFGIAECSMQEPALIRKKDHSWTKSWKEAGSLGIAHLIFRWNYFSYFLLSLQDRETCWTTRPSQQVR